MDTKRRGVAFTGGEGPCAEAARALVPAGALVATADSGLLAAEAAGIAPDWVVGDMDSLGGATRLGAYPPDRVRRHSADKDETDTELALSLLWGEGCGEVWLLGGGGGRLDHLLAVRALFDRERTPERWVTAREDIRRVDSGGALAAEGLGENALVSVFPAGDGPWAAASEGLRWPLDGLSWERGRPGVSNRAPTGGFTLRVLAGRFLVVMPLRVPG
ncbi:MAG: thiamine pyrophosphokinase [Treponematales bacterium]